jgi:hypothetical protein
LPSSTGGRNIHYIEFEFDIADKEEAVEHSAIPQNGTA